MEIFPTQYSVLSSQALKLAIEKNYGMSLFNCRLLVHNVSDTYLAVSSTGKYVFKIYREPHRTREEIEGEVQLLSVLKDRGAAVSYPIAALNGGFLQSFQAAEGLRYGVLFSYAHGKVITALDAEKLENIGLGMAKIHEITSTVKLDHYRKAYNTETLLHQPIRTIAPAFAEMKEEYAWLKDTAERVANKINSFDLSRFSYGYCHYDFLPKNFHFDQDGKVTFFDFDFAGKGVLANDLATFYVHFFLETYYQKTSQEQADQQYLIFIEAYRSKRPLIEDEVKAIPYLGFAFWIFYFGFHYENFDDWSNFFFTPRFIRERVSLIKHWVGCYCDFK